MKRAFLTTLLIAVIGAATADAQAPPPRDVHALRISSPIAIDGALSEPEWQRAEIADGFKQREPNEGADASQRTEVRVLFDDDALYIGARMFDAHADSIIANLTRRDTHSRSDEFRVCLDPYYDRRSGYYFSINAAGTLFDGTLYNDGWSDGSWDAVWEGRARVDRDGWTAEMRIPFSQLRFPRGAAQKWGINFQRSMGRGFEDSYLVFQPRKESGFVSRFPSLVGLANVSPGRAIEIVPYATSKAQFQPHEPLDPFNDGSELSGNAGGDVRMALGNRLTLNGTINPDFGQVEVDPAVVNLSDVETFFPEKRPFFVEGGSIFDAGQQGASDYWGFNWSEPTFFYSRRIGRAPLGSVPDTATFTDVPNGTTILGAAKLSGKVGNGVNVGMLHALTGQENARLVMPDGSRIDPYEVEPGTYYGVGRVSKEFPQRRHGLGMIATVAARNFEDPRLEDEFNHHSLLAALDGWHFLDRTQTWVVSGWAGASHVAGTRARIATLQTDPRHYFQRPDAKHSVFDSTATSLDGGGARLWLNKEKGNWISNSAVGFLSPGFEVNDLGFLNRADVVNFHLGGGYKWTTPTPGVKNHNLIGALFGSTNFDGDLTDAGVWGSAFWWYRNDWTLQVRGAYNPETVNPRRSRGGPLMLNRPGYESSVFFDTDGSRSRYYYVDAYAYVQPEEDSWNWHLNPFINWKPRSNLSIAIGPGFEQSRDSAYPFATVDDAIATNTYGHRYVFAVLEQKTLSANVRFNISFTPRVSLEFFGQPLISTGSYTDLRELARPKSLDFIGPGAGAWTYDPASGLFDPDGPGGEDPYTQDFNFKSLRGNAVFRWEYRPGSTFFFVWTQERTDQQPTSEFDIGSSFQRLIEADADNIFLAKVTYYLNI